MLDPKQYEEIGEEEQLQDLWVPLQGTTIDGKTVILVKVYKPDGTIETKFFKHKPA